MEELNVLEAASWPDSLPHPDADFVFSVVCETSHCRWCVLAKDPDDGTLSPTIFWKTSPVSANDMSDDSSRILLKYLPDKVKEYIYGVDSHTYTRERAREYSNARRIPILHLYLISTNSAHEKGIAFLFRDIPSRIIRLNNVDFFTPQQGCFKTMGVERAAAARAAAGLYGYPCLVLDGGTMLTYTAVDVHGQLQGGGICQGLGLRLKSLARYTGKLPAIKVETALAIIESRRNSNQPFGLFATRTEDAILGTIVRELAFLLRNVVDEWVAQAKEMLETVPRETTNGNAQKYNGELVVCITGGDCDLIGKLLQPNFGNIIATGTSTRSDAFMSNELAAHTKLSVNKQLLHQALPALVVEKAHNGTSEFDDIRTALIGQRVAAKLDKDGNIYRGTIASCQLDVDFAKDAYRIRYDDDRGDMDLVQLHAALLLYVKIGEEKDSEDDTIRESQEEKRRGAKKAAERLGEELSILRPVPTTPVKDLTTSAEDIFNAAVAVGSTGREEMSQTVKSSHMNIPDTLDVSVDEEAVGVEAAGEKRERNLRMPSPPNSRVQKKRKVGEDLIGSRVAKFFDKELYFGTVAKFLPAEMVEEKVDVWVIEYDDGDVEDFDASELKKHSALYKRRQGEDLKPTL